MKRRVSVLSFFCLAMVVALFAFGIDNVQSAQSDQSAPKMQCRDRFKAMDANDDGKITKEEFTSGPHKGVGGKALEESFKAADADGDGVLSEDEFCADKGMRKGKNKTE